MGCTRRSSPRTRGACLARLRGGARSRPTSRSPAGPEPRRVWLQAWRQPGRGSWHRASSILGERIVGITVEPAFPRFRGRDHRVTAGSRVLGRVTVRRVVATARATALLTGTKVHPSGADLHALLALVAL